MYVHYSSEGHLKLNPASKLYHYLRHKMHFPLYVDIFLAKFLDRDLKLYKYAFSTYVRKYECIKCPITFGEVVHTAVLFVFFYVIRYFT